MTQLLATEQGMTVDAAGFEAAMEKQRALGRAAQKKEIVVAATEGDAAADLKPTKFLGYTQHFSHAKLIDVVRAREGRFRRL